MRAYLGRLTAGLAEGAQYTQDSFWRKLGGNPSVFLDQPALAGLKLPVLVVWGEQDTLVPPAFGRDYAAWIAGARWVTIPAAGPAPGVEQPRLFLAAVLPFLAGKD